MSFFRRRRTVTVPDRYGFGTGDTMEVAARPDVEHLFDGADETELTRLAVGYLNHPDPAVRLAAVRQAPGATGTTVAVEEELVDRLADTDPAVRSAAAGTIWQLNRDTCCKRPVMILRDEVRGHTMSTGMPGTGSLRLGRDSAVQALDTLLAAAPDEDARRGLQALVDQHVVIAQRVAPDPGLDLELIEKVHRVVDGQAATYEAYRASSRTEAIAFLNARPVAQEFYYLEVETPDGTFGRDIKGVYDL